MRNPANQGGAAINARFGLDRTKHSVVATPPQDLAAGPQNTAPNLAFLDPWRGHNIQRVQRNVQRICALGDRAICEAFAELARDHDLANEIAELLDRYAALDPDHVNLGNANRFAPHPLMKVPSWMPKS